MMSAVPSTPPSGAGVQPVTDVTAAKAGVSALAERISGGEIADDDALTIDAELKALVARCKAPLQTLRTQLKAELKKFKIAGRRAYAGSTTCTDVEIDPATIVAEREAAWAVCEGLATSSDLLKRVFDAVARLGVTGDRAGALCTFLTAISRFLSEPVRMLRRGSASSGKSYVIDKILALLDPADVVIVTSGSVKALFYTERDLRHCLIFIPEAAALVPAKGGGDEFAMVVRELVSSGRLVYHTVQPVGENGALVGVELVKDGPVALLMTTARENVEEELLTRLLVTVTDERDAQTKLILDAVAARAAGIGPEPLSQHEIAQFHALQRWLKLGPREVIVPFAPAIASLVDRRGMRVRRDFPQIISLTKSSALLHRAQRHQDAQGRIIAELVDYGVAIAALGEGLDELVHGDTTTIAAVRNAIVRSLTEERLVRGRNVYMGAFRDTLSRHLAGTGNLRAVERFGQARQAPGGKSLTDTVMGCIATLERVGGPKIETDTLRQLWRTAADLGKASTRKLDHDRPDNVEISTQRLAVALGIGRHAARARLDAAIEVGAVIDVGAADRNRPRTAPKLLAPGPATTVAPTQRNHRGAFPSLSAVQAAWSRMEAGDEWPSRPSGQVEN